MTQFSIKYFHITYDIAYWILHYIIPWEMQVLTSIKLTTIIIIIIVIYCRLVAHTDAIIDTRAQEMVSHYIMPNIYFIFTPWLTNVKWSCSVIYIFI